MVLVIGEKNIWALCLFEKNILLSLPSKKKNGSRKKTVCSSLPHGPIIYMIYGYNFKRLRFIQGLIRLEVVWCDHLFYDVVDSRLDQYPGLFQCKC